MTLDIAAIKARADKASGQSWQAWNMVHGDTGKPMTPDELGEYVKNTVLKSIEDGGSADQFLFVSFDGEGNSDICHVGNGPNRAANAAFIAHARTDIPALIAALESSEGLLRQAIEALRTLQRQALQSSVNDGNEWGKEALEMTRTVLAIAKDRGL